MANVTEDACLQELSTIIGTLMMSVDSIRTISALSGTSDRVLYHAPKGQCDCNFPSNKRIELICGTKARDLQEGKSFDPASCAPALQDDLHHMLEHYIDIMNEQLEYLTQLTEKVMPLAMFVSGNQQEIFWQDKIRQGGS